MPGAAIGRWSPMAKANKTSPQLHVPASDSYRRLIASLTDQSVILLGADGRILSWNRGAQHIKGYTEEEILGQHFSVLYTPEAVAIGHPQSTLEVAQVTGRYEEDGWRVRKDGTRFWASVIIIAIRGEDGTLEGYGKLTRDLTERMQADQQAANTLRILRLTAETDPLTGTLSRRALASGLQAAQQRGVTFCAAMLDLDNFKQLNDRLGHAAGDRILRQVTAVWTEGLRPGDLLARYGGEEFALLIQDCNLQDGIRTVERIRASASSACTCSAGVAAWSPGIDTIELLDAADAALYEAKRRGRDRTWPARYEIASLERYRHGSRQLRLEDAG